MSTANATIKNVEDYIKFYKKKSKKLWKTRETIIKKTLKGLFKGASVLDVGCGIGDNYKIISDFGFNVLGLDNSNEMLRMSRKKNPLGAFQKKDFAKVKPQTQAQYDLVFAQDFLQVFSKSGAPDVIKTMLYLSKKRIFLSTTLHDTPSEKLADYEEEEDYNIPKYTITDDGEPTKKYCSKYTRAELQKLVDDALLNINREYSDSEEELKKYKWVAHSWEFTDPYGDLWYNIQFDRLTIKEYYDKQGYIVMNNFFNLLDIEKFTNEVEYLRDRKPTGDSSYLRYNDYINDKKKAVFDCVENAAANCSGLNPLVSTSMQDLASWYLDCPVIFLKDKVEFNVPQKPNMPPKQEANSKWSKLSPKHITIAICLDDADTDSGAMYFVPEVYKQKQIFSEPDQPIAEDRFDGCQWKYTPTKKGDVIIFDSYTPYKTTPNNSMYPRRMIFLTFVEFNDDLRIKYDENSSMKLSHEYFNRKKSDQPPIDEPLHKDFINIATRTPFGEFVLI